MLFVDPERMSNVRWIARRLRVVPLPVTFVPFGTLAQLFQRSHSDIGDTVAIELQRAALSPTEQVVKRGFDIVFSLLALICLSPLMLAVAVAIRLNSPGPILFRQTRHGFNGRPFGIYKFRSMTVMEDGDVVRQARKRDARVTRVGYWLRRFSIDELPQLLNVLIGDMSLSPASRAGLKSAARGGRPTRSTRSSGGSSLTYGTLTTGAFGWTSQFW
jgi:putative colanic acid biosynthesis UDP-glucose lipid carrier transferase